MNPILILILFLLIYKENNRFPNYYDTFHLEKLLNQLQYTINSLDKINHLNQLAHSPLERGNLVPTIEDSIHTVKPLLPSNSTSVHHLDNIESFIGNIQKVGNIQNIMQTYGPLLKPMLASMTSSSTANYISDDNPDLNSCSAHISSTDSEPITFDAIDSESLSDYIDKMLKKGDSR